MGRVESAGETGAVVRSVRKEQGLTQAQLADQSGVGLSFVSNIERGKPTSEPQKVPTVLMTLGLDISVAKRGE